MFYRLYSLKIPTVALIAGHAPAGGTMLATACDFRVMVNNPKLTIGLNEVRTLLQSSHISAYWFGDPIKKQSKTERSR